MYESVVVHVVTFERKGFVETYGRVAAERNVDEDRRSAETHFYVVQCKIVAVASQRVVDYAQPNGRVSRRQLERKSVVFPFNLTHWFSAYNAGGVTCQKRSVHGEYFKLQIGIVGRTSVV